MSVPIKIVVSKCRSKRYGRRNTVLFINIFACLIFYYFVFHYNQENESIITQLSTLRIKLNNKYWQQLDWSEGSFFLWRAFYDDRPSFKKIYIRIPAMTKMKSSPALYCHIFYTTYTKDTIDGTHMKSYTVKAKILYTWIWGTQPDNHIQPILISCPVDSTLPIKVSLSFDSSFLDQNLLHVIHGHEKREGKKSLQNVSKGGSGMKNKKFAVCIKWLDFYDHDVSLRIIEWIEMIKILGGGHVFMSQLHVHKNISKVLDYYISTGFITVTNFTLPGNQPNEPKEQYEYLYNRKNLYTKMANEAMPLYNSLYQAILKRYQYAVIFDIDEILIPVKHYDWHDLLAEIESRENSQKVDDFAVSRTNFLDQYTDQNEKLVRNIPPYLHMMRHIHSEVKSITPPKSFTKLDRVVSISFQWNFIHSISFDFHI